MILYLTICFYLSLKKRKKMGGLKMSAQHLHDKCISKDDFEKGG